MGRRVRRAERSGAGAVIPPSAGARCGLTVIGGFLGAGKTTLLNRLLAAPQGRYAVLVNDFGAVNVDAALIAGHDGKTLRLTNGCVCCSLADGLADALLRVLAEPYDHIVVEASGVADPASIAEIAAIEPALALSTVIVLADAERLSASLADARIGDTVRRQIKAADIVVLNKRDLVDDAGHAAALAALRSVDPLVRVVDAVFSEVPLAVMDLGPQRDRIAQHPPARPASRFAADDASHEAMFCRILYRRGGRFDSGALAAALAALPPSLLRLKGAVTLADGARRTVQVVGTRWTLSPPPPAMAWPIELVGIGVDASRDPAAVEQALDAALCRS